MGLSNALTTAVSGLTSHQKALDNIGNNLANVNTTGFKKGVYQFSTLLEQTLRGGMASTGTTGSVNPIALGFGAQTGSISKAFGQSSVEYTGSDGDMAIDGNGFFVVKNGKVTAYTRDGTFKLDEDGNLVNSQGMYVQGTMAVKNSSGGIDIPQDSKLESINIALGSIGGMAKTSNVSFVGNLNHSANTASGLNLYGSIATPSVDNLQSWMSTNQTVDDSWTALQDATYFIWEDMKADIEAAGLDVPAGAAEYKKGTVPTSFTHLYDPNTNTYAKIADDPALVTLLGGETVSGADILAAGFVPVIQAINTVNGGNVQTSQAMGITVPEYAAGSATGLVYPQSFYEANGAVFGPGTMEYEDMFALATELELNDAYAVIFPKGFQNSGDVFATTTSIPGDTMAAWLGTPLEDLYVYQNSKWTKMFNNLQEGDEITLSFDKGESTVNATFIYNKATDEDQPITGNQQSVNNERSYTLEHFLTFLAGDVNQTATIGANITRDMYATDEEYNQALADLALAQNGTSTGGNTGVMGLVDVGPLISASKGGQDTADAPLETAGAYTREGVSTVSYTQNGVTQSGQPSFNVSILSNLGTENALSNISVKHNNVTSKTLFSNEPQYAAPQGNSSSVGVTFYDSLGNAHTATVRMTQVGSDSNFTTWRWYADCLDDTDFGWIADPNTGEIISSLSVGTGIFRFDTDGNFVNGSDYSETGGIVIDLVNQGVDDTIHLAIMNGLNSKEKQDLDFSGLKYSASPTDVSMASQNGSPPGSLESYEVALDGTVYGVYSTGSTVPLARLVLATVPNMHGLRAGANNLFYTTPASGDAQYGYPTNGGRGDILQYNLETSNVEMSEEFTKMISIERGYQANSRIVSVADEMLQELLSMVR